MSVTKMFSSLSGFFWGANSNEKNNTDADNEYEITDDWVFVGSSGDSGMKVNTEEEVANVEKNFNDLLKAASNKRKAMKTNANLEKVKKNLDNNQVDQLFKKTVERSNKCSKKYFKKNKKSKELVLKIPRKN